MLALQIPPRPRDAQLLLEHRVRDLVDLVLVSSIRGNGAMSSFMSCRSLNANRAVWNFFSIMFVSASLQPVSSAGNMREPPCGVHTKDATKLLRAQIRGFDGVRAQTPATCSGASSLRAAVVYAANSLLVFLIKHVLMTRPWLIGSQGFWSKSVICLACFSLRCFVSSFFTAGKALRP